ncbi:RNA binding protein, putative [Babesia ovata]|uniref:RNA binding protein, putative n=1 Tax=Babesia ovata TaxID=189622 RepID=A0A2H6KAJ4_9APIC|nr:RNA binding protein, putative [Babesia ovata]GBE60013.1 RNA binding protein, putative [Babesia ovata]
MQLRYFSIVNDSSWRLLLKGLPFDATTEEVRALFANNGSVKSVTLVRKGAEPTGSAIVRFASEVEAVRALKDFRDVYVRKRKIEAILDFTEFTQRIQRVHKPIAVDRFRLPLRFF